MTVVIRIGGESQQGPSGLVSGAELYDLANRPPQRLFLNREDGIDIPISAEDHILIKGNENFVLGDSRIEDKSSPSEGTQAGVQRRSRHRARSSKDRSASPEGAGSSVPQRAPLRGHPGRRRCGNLRRRATRRAGDRFIFRDPAWGMPVDRLTSRNAASTTVGRRPEGPIGIGLIARRTPPIPRRSTVKRFSHELARILLSGR